MLKNPNVTKCLDEAIRLYRLSEEKCCKSVNYNIAKSQYEKALWLVDSLNGEQDEMAPSQRRLYFQSRKDLILECLAESEIREKQHQKMFNDKLSSKLHYHLVYVHNLFARCNLLRAKLFAALEDEVEALRHIVNAKTNLSHG